MEGAAVGLVARGTVLSATIRSGDPILECWSLGYFKAYSAVVWELSPPMNNAEILGSNSNMTPFLLGEIPVPAERSAS